MVKVPQVEQQWNIWYRELHVQAEENDVISQILILFLTFQHKYHLCFTYLLCFNLTSRKLLLRVAAML